MSTNGGDPIIEGLRQRIEERKNRLAAYDQELTALRRDERALAMLEGERYPRAKTPPSPVKAGRKWHGTGVSPERMNVIGDLLRERFRDREFTVKEVVAEAPFKEMVIRAALEKFREEGAVRQSGRRGTGNTRLYRLGRGT